MDPSATPAVPLSQLVVSWVLAAAAVVAAGFTAWGTRTLARVGKEQNRREGERQKREATPHLLLTGGRDRNSGTYVVAIVNMSADAVWLDGAYVGGGTSNVRDGSQLKIRVDGLSNYATLLERGQSAELMDALPAPTQGAGESPTAARLKPRRGEVVAKFYYSPTGNELHERAWRVRSDSHDFKAEDLHGMPEWYAKRRRGG